MKKTTEYNPRIAHRDTDLFTERYSSDTLRVHWHFQSIESLLYFRPFLAPHYKVTDTAHGTIISFLVHVVCIGRTYVQDGLSKHHSYPLVWNLRYYRPRLHHTFFQNDVSEESAIAIQTPLCKRLGLPRVSSGTRY